MQWVARVPGVWPKILDEADTRRLLDGLYRLEVAAEAWRVDAFPDISRPQTVHAAACLEGGFRISGLRGEPIHWVPWDKVELVAAGKIIIHDHLREVSPPGWVHALSTGFRAAVGRGPRTPRKARAQRSPRDPIGELILVRRDPRLTFRVVENQMNYGYLADRLRTSAADNFPLLLADVRRLASGAYITPPTDALLDGGDPDDYEFDGPKELLDDATLCLLWNWYRRDRDKDALGTGDHPLYPGA